MLNGNYFLPFIDHMAFFKASTCKEIYNDELIEILRLTGVNQPGIAIKSSILILIKM